MRKLLLIPVSIQLNFYSIKFHLNSNSFRCWLMPQLITVITFGLNYLNKYKLVQRESWSEMNERHLEMHGVLKLNLVGPAIRLILTGLYF